MNTITLDKKKYVIIPEREYKTILRKAGLNLKPEKRYSVSEAKALTDKMIDKWFKEQSK